MSVKEKSLLSREALVDIEITRLKRLNYKIIETSDRLYIVIDKNTVAKSMETNPAVSKFIKGEKGNGTAIDIPVFTYWKNNMHGPENLRSVVNSMPEAFACLQSEAEEVQVKKAALVAKKVNEAFPGVAAVDLRERAPSLPSSPSLSEQVAKMLARSTGSEKTYSNRQALAG